MKLKLELRFEEKIIINLRYADDTTLMAETEEEGNLFAGQEAAVS